MDVPADSAPAGLVASRMVLDRSFDPRVHVATRFLRLEDMKTFEHEWILEALVEHRTFFTTSMFSGLAAYLFERQTLLLVEPTKSGRWNWHVVLVCTDYEHHASIQADFPALMPHEVLRKWLFIDSTHEDFESTMEAGGATAAPGLYWNPASDSTRLSIGSDGTGLHLPGSAWIAAERLRLTCHGLTK